MSRILADYLQPGGLFRTDRGRTALTRGLTSGEMLSACAPGRTQEYPDTFGVAECPGCKAVVAFLILPGTGPRLALDLHVLPCSFVVVNHVCGFGACVRKKRRRK